MSGATPVLNCPDCGEPLISAHGRGRFDEDGNFIEHRGSCRCPWCGWMWFDDQEPVVCACGSVVGVNCDDDHAYAVVLKAKQ